MARAVLLAAMVPLAAFAESLDPTLTVVLGGGLSAGYADFRLVESAQFQAWPVVAARQMDTYIAVPTLRDPGQAGPVNAWRPLGQLAPRVLQSGERALPFPFYAMNLSVPFLRAGDALRLRPRPQYDSIKLIASIEGDLKQTFVNAILGGPLLTLPEPLLLTQTEYAAALNPTLAFVQLGFEDVVDAALENDASRITAAGAFSADYLLVLRHLLNSDATVIAMTVPDPTTSAYFHTVDQAARRYGMSPSDLQSRFGVAPGDLITLAGMTEIGDAQRGRRRPVLSAGSVLRANVADAVRAAVASYNTAILEAARGTRVQVYDLAAFVRQVENPYGAGFYSEDGLYPTAAGQAQIANSVLQFLNSKFGTSFRPAVIP